MINLESGKKNFDCNSRKYLSKYLRVQALDFDSFFQTGPNCTFALLCVNIFLLRTPILRSYGDCRSECY